MYLKIYLIVLCLLIDYKRLQQNRIRTFLKVKTRRFFYLTINVFDNHIVLFTHLIIRVQ